MGDHAPSAGISLDISPLPLPIFEPHRAAAHAPGIPSYIGQPSWIDPSLRRATSAEELTISVVARLMKARRAIGIGTDIRGSLARLVIFPDNSASFFVGTLYGVGWALAESRT
jgi:hypothetical protein